MDADTTAKKGGHEAILEAFANREADILIGTQMIVKGHDFPGVTLVGILAADLSLNTPDYRSAERTFQLLTQAAGRAGRAGKPAMWSSRRTGRNTMPCRRQRRRIMSCFTAMRSITGGCFIIHQSARWLRFILPAAMRRCWMNVRKWRRGGCAKVPSVSVRFRHRYTKLMTSTEKFYI